MSCAATIERPRVLSVFRQALRGRLVVLCAAAGYGKTILVRQAAQCPPPTETWAVYTAPGGEIEPPRLYAGMAAAIAEVSRQAPNGAPRAAGTIRDVLRDLERVAGTERVVLVVDGLPHLGPAFLSAFDGLLAHLPPRVTLVVATRSMCRWPQFARLAADELAQRLEEPALGYTAKEAALAGAARYGVTLAEAGWQELVELTRGWPAVLMLACRHLAGRRGRVPVAGVRELLLCQAVEEYLESVVLNVQPPDLVRFLERAAVLRTLTVDRCAALTGGSDASIRLADAETCRLIQAVPRRAVTGVNQTVGERYRMAEVLRLHLLHRLAGREGASMVQGLHLEAAGLLEHDGRPGKVIEHLLAAQAYEAAAAAILRAAATLRAEQGTAQLEAWLHALPVEVMDSHPELLYVAARVCRLRGQYAPARLFAQRAWGRLPADAAAGARAAVLLEWGAAEHGLGSKDTASRRLAEAAGAVGQAVEDDAIVPPRHRGGEAIWPAPHAIYAELYALGVSALPAYGPQGSGTATQREPADDGMAALVACPDAAIGARLVAAVRQGLRAEGLIALKTTARLTWRELDVFVAYYLLPAGVGRRTRRELAAALALSDHTLRHHVRQVRRKLGLQLRHRRAAALTDVASAATLRLWETPPLE